MINLLWDGKDEALAMDFSWKAGDGDSDGNSSGGLHSGGAYCQSTAPHRSLPTGHWLSSAHFTDFQRSNIMSWRRRVNNDIIVENGVIILLPSHPYAEWFVEHV